ncbi:MULTISPECIES: hypothetical protein [unclassified Streptomyces]|uniref:hypothetical protein n=1 Tax=unclassified Streptomyces TaxID=2593676 RepID=UPI000CD50E0A|nr:MULTISPECIES: hypothetical protein [unclassified Streptomyces]
MLRRATITGSSVLAVAALTVGLTACNATLNGDDGLNGGSAPAGNSIAQPGRHSGLPEPCGAPEENRLRQLLPDADVDALRGAPHMTYDTGRRFGCDWSSQGSDASHTLTVDFLRVISYDPDVSDNDLAADDFARRADRAGIEPAPDDSADDTESGADDGDDDGSGRQDGGADGRESANNPTPDGGVGSGVRPGRPTGDLAPRALDDIGTAAYVDDRLSSDGTRRDITLVFHSANVIVAIDYSEAVNDPVQEPDSAALQERVRSLADQLAGRLDG